MRLQIFETETLWAAAIADQVVEILDAAVLARGRASLVLPGGTTPRRFLAALAARRWRRWSAVTITLTDERVVPTTDRFSNEGMLRQILLPLLPEAPHVAGLCSNGLPDIAAAERALASVPQPLDLVILGMGNDGHIASIFPNHTALAADNHVILVEDAPIRAPVRITIGLSALRAARNILITIAGQTKRSLIEDSIASPKTKLPIGRLLATTKAPVSVYWCA